MNLISKFALLIVVAAIVYLVASGNLLTPVPLIIAIQLLAVALSIWARRSFAKGQFSIHAEPGAGSLILAGPYKFIRHPMYTFALIIVWSSVLGHASLYTLLVSIVVSIVAAIRIVTEEKALRGKYPGYIDYSQKTKRIIPFIF